MKKVEGCLAAQSSRACSDARLRWQRSCKAMAATSMATYIGVLELAMSLCTYRGYNGVLTTTPKPAIGGYNKFAVGSHEIAAYK